MNADYVQKNVNNDSKNLPFDEIASDFIKTTPIEALPLPLQKQMYENALVNKYTRQAEQKIDTTGLVWENETERFLSLQNSKITASNYKRGLIRFYEWVQKKQLNAFTLTYANADQYVIDLKNKQTKQGKSNSYTRLAIASVSAFYTYIERYTEGKVKNAFRGVRLPPKKDAKQIIIPTKKDIDIILENIPPLQKAILAVCVYNGLRIGALPTLILNSNSKTYNGYSKGKELKKIKLHSTALEYIKKANLNLLQPFSKMVVTNEKRLLNYYLKKLKNKGLINAVFSHHDFRHYFAITQYQKDHDIYKLKALLNHSSIATTETYLKSLDIDI